MKNSLHCLFICCVLSILSSLTIGEIEILPTPEQVQQADGFFTLTSDVVIVYDNNSSESAAWLAQRLKKPAGLKLCQKKADKHPLSGVNTITFKKNSGDTLGDEGYILTVEKEAVCIQATSEAGFFYGCQSLLQLLPAEIFGHKQTEVRWTVPCVTIIDRPRCKWRGFMLDSGRQYQRPEFIKRYLDQMAVMKMNRFHWHLTEGQGWRLQIDKYPKLTSIGSKVAEGDQQQGFYTKQEMRDIVTYAKKLHIEIVPEIDLPGHSEAALIAYPEMACLRQPPKSVMGFSENLFCAGREKTYQFLEDVFDEVCEIFPFEYIHIGGDEAPKGIWNKCADCQKKISDEGLKNSHDLQIYFSNRLADFLSTKGRKVICWGDVVASPGPELRENIVIQWWNWRARKDKGLKEAIRLNREVICNTNYYTYLNFPVTPWLPKYEANRTFDLKTCYENNPSDVKSEILEKHPNVLGISACLWTDWHVKEDMVDRRVFPRVYALAEQMWHQGERLSFDEFYRKLKAHYPRFKAAGIDYGPAMKEEIPEGYKWD